MQAAISIFERFVDSFLEKRDPAKASDDKLEKSMLGSLAEVHDDDASAGCDGVCGCGGCF